jgi:allene oxide cyclase
MERLKSLLAAALALAPLAASAGEKLHVVERATNETTTHVTASKAADAIADQLTFANPVFDAANKTQIGTDLGHCVRIEVGKSWDCYWTLILKSGMIMIAGPFYDKGDSTFMVVGGSGKYAGAKGQMTLHDRGTTPTTYDFVYELL